MRKVCFVGAWANKNLKMLTQTLTDNLGSKWRIDELINNGGFGTIYSATCSNQNSHLALERVVIKVQKNEAVACMEKDVFELITSEKRLQFFKLTKKIDFLGFPTLYGMNVIKNRLYLIMPHYSTNLRRFIKENNISKRRVFKIAVHMLNAIEFLHSQSIVHRDIKADNIVFDTVKQPILIDYGLCSIVGKRRFHKSKYNYDGTLNYCSVDGHTGHITRVSDVENLLYCLFNWLQLTVPWRNRKAPAVFEIKMQTKESNYTDIVQCFDWKDSPKRISIFRSITTYVANLPRYAIPDYSFLRKQLHKLAVPNTILKISQNNR